MLSAALRGVGLVYLHEQALAPHVQSGALELVLEEYAPTTPGFFLYFPRHGSRQPKLRALIDVARRVLGTSPGPRTTSSALAGSAKPGSGTRPPGANRRGAKGRPASSGGATARSS